jgi:hypothetical protein
VLFTPRPDLSDAQQGELATTLARSLDEIASVRRYQVGRRVKLGTTYDREAPLDFTFLVVIEFDDQDGLVTAFVSGDAGLGSDGHPIHGARARRARTRTAPSSPQAATRTTR